MERRTLLVVLAFAAVYLIWGSTYLAIRFAVEEMPPFLMAAGRWLIAGALVLAWRRMAGDPMPSVREWRSAAVVGIALILGGNGLVSWAEQWVPSALAALLIAIVPMWIAIGMWMRTKQPPAPRVAAGIVLGFVGVVLLFAPGVRDGMGGSTAFLVGTVAILVATLSWAAGSLYSRGAPQPKSTFMGVAIQMLAGGVALAAVGLVAGELPRLDLGAVGPRGWISFWFLTLLGSIVAFTAYIWLLKNVAPALVATYAFVNPIVAVVLGILLAGETFSTLTIVASGLIVVGVALVVTAGSKGRGPAPGAPEAPRTAATPPEP